MLHGIDLACKEFNILNLDSLFYKTILFLEYKNKNYSRTCVLEIKNTLLWLEQNVKNSFEHSSCINSSWDMSISEHLYKPI